MPVNMDMVYTENPYVDIIVYYTKLLGIDTVLKMQKQAQAHETVESVKNADMLIACKEGTAIFELFDGFSENVLRKSGLIGEPLANALINPATIPMNMRKTVLENAKREFIDNYEELNDYYRMLAGLPPKNYEDIYVTDWEPPEEVHINLSTPIHKMSDEAIVILKNYGVLDDMYNEDPTNRAYLKYIDRKIDPYTARKAGPFGVLYIPQVDQEEIEREYREKLDINIQYVLKAIYSDAYAYDSDYYDNIMAIFIVLNSMIDVITRVQEFIARREVFDMRTVQYIFESFGVDFFPEIPLRYQIAMVKNLHTLLKYKSTSRCMIEICSLFGMDNIQIFKYYLLRQRNYNKETGEYSFTGDWDTDFSLKFVKIPIDEPMDNYIRDPANYMDYDEVTLGDPTWTGGLEHDYVREQHLDFNYNYVRTKYMSIDSIFDISKMMAQQCYFFNMLYDNVELEDLITVNIPAISGNTAFKVADVFTFLTSLTHFYYNRKDLILDTQGKIMYVYGFDFNADLAAISESIEQMRFDKECQEILAQFNLPTDSIPTFNQLMNIFRNNMNVRDLILAGMRNADSLRHYLPYKKLYDSLMTMELTFDHFKNPETGDFYRDAEGDATYAAYLQNEAPLLYYKLIEIQMIEDDDLREQTISTLVDNIVYILEQWIDGDEFLYIFHELPAVSVDAIREYISMVIDFYKSYKVHILGINSIYYFDDPYADGGYIQLIDDLLLNRWFEKDEIITLIDKFFKTSVKMEKKEKIEFVERLFFSIWTWAYKYFDDKIELIDLIQTLYSRLFKEDEIFLEELISRINTTMLGESSVTLIDKPYWTDLILWKDDKISFVDRMWIGINYSMEISIGTSPNSIEFSIDNIEIPIGPGGTTINDTRITANSMAKFIVNESLVDLNANITCTCNDGSISLLSDCNYPIYGTLYINNEYEDMSFVTTEGN